MLINLKIQNFRNIKTFSYNDFWFKNHIFWINWIWKTNLLYAIFIIFQNKIDFDYKDLVSYWEKDFFLEAIFFNNWFENKITYHYDILTNKKTIFLNWKKTTKKILNQNIVHTSFFSPLSMNIFYLWPKYRRNFLDNTLIYSYEDYKNIYSKYEDILKNRNKLLKNISEWKSKKDEMFFFDELFLEYSEKIYLYKLEYIQYLKTKINDIKKYIHKEYFKIDFVYKTKIDFNNIKKSIKEYNDKNFQRDIILWKTNIWPHLDDFDILINDKSILNFLSRWEVKVFILFLKFLEISYIKLKTNKNSIILIDDILSELDSNHLEKITNIFSDIQFVSSWINSISNINNINLT